MKKPPLIDPKSWRDHLEIQLLRSQIEELAIRRRVDAKRISELEAEIARLHRAYNAYEHEIQQLLGKALGWPWYKDDQKNFPGATEADGVFVGEHVAVTLAAEIAEAHVKALARIKELEENKQ